MLALFPNNRSFLLFCAVGSVQFRYAVLELLVGFNEGLLLVFVVLEFVLLCGELLLQGGDLFLFCDEMFF